MSSSTDFETTTTFSTGETFFAHDDCVRFRQPSAEGEQSRAQISADSSAKSTFLFLQVAQSSACAAFGIIVLHLHLARNPCANFHIDHLISLQRTTMIYFRLP